MRPWPQRGLGASPARGRGAPQEAGHQVILHEWRRWLLQIEDTRFFRMSEDEEKVKLSLLEPAIQKFTKIVIPTDLERLRKHQINIEKQICSNIREMEKLCLEVQRDDLGLLKRMIDPVKEEASAPHSRISSTPSRICRRT